MRVQIQPDNYSCGIYSIINALLVYGEELNREQVKEFTGTTARKGTDEKGIQKALKELGYKYRVYKTNNKNNAWKWVLRNSNKPLILYVDNNHWIVVAGKINNKVIVLDRITEVLTKEELLERWHPCWAISIYPKE